VPLIVLCGVELGDARRLGIGGNRFLPVTDPGEDVRGHVLRVRRRSGNL